MTKLSFKRKAIPKNKKCIKKLMNFHVYPVGGGVNTIPCTFSTQ